MPVLFKLEGDIFKRKSLLLNRLKNGLKAAFKYINNIKTII